VPRNLVSERGGVKRSGDDSLIYMAYNSRVSTLLAPLNEVKKISHIIITEGYRKKYEDKKRVSSCCRMLGSY
jgi:hypothetical protein